MPRRRSPASPPASGDGPAAPPPTELPAPEPEPNGEVSKEVAADILEQIARLLDLTGENPFKVRAYENGARALRGLDRDLGTALRDGTLRGMKGIGPALLEKVTTLAGTGRLEYYEKLRAGVPPGLLQILRLPGLGPKKVRSLHLQLGVAGIEDLEAACRQDRLVGLEGFGVRSQEKILAEIERFRRYASRYHIHRAWDQAETILAALRGLAAVKRAAVAGSLRRRMETCKDIDLLAAVGRRQRDSVMAEFVALAGVTEVVARGDTKTSVRLDSGIQVDLRLVEDAEFPFALHYFTGSKAHNIAMRQRAERRGLKLNEYGLFRGESPIPCGDEEAVFAALDLPFIPPELREDQGEIEAAAEGRLPDLLGPRDLPGILHNHTTWSDGTASLEEMVRAAEAAGHRYFGLTDHSRAATYARGLSAEDLRRQQAEVDAWNRESRGIPILKGTECDILPDGSLDYDPETLATFDFVVASVHSAFHLSREEMTRRVEKALAHPRVTIWGHPTGRLLLEREAYAIDLERAVRSAAEHGVAVEINGNPFRLDLDWRMHAFARSVGARFSINPDAHTAAGVEDTAWGVGIARKGWVTAAEVINALPLEELQRQLEARRR